MAFGRGNAIDGHMPMSLSADLGKTWTYAPSPFPPIGGGQRLVAAAAQAEGPIFFASFAKSMTVKDAAGQPRKVSGLFGAVSLRRGQDLARAQADHRRRPAARGRRRRQHGQVHRELGIGRAPRLPVGLPDGRRRDPTDLQQAALRLQPGVARGADPGRGSHTSPSASEEQASRVGQGRGSTPLHSQVLPRSGVRKILQVDFHPRARQPAFCTSAMPERIACSRDSASRCKVTMTTPARELGEPSSHPASKRSSTS